MCDHMSDLSRDTSEPVKDFMRLMFADASSNDVEGYWLVLAIMLCRTNPDLWRHLNLIKKSYTKTGKKCRVTFKLPSLVSADSALLLGEFNNWDNASSPMKKLKNGDFSTTLSLNAGQSYRFRYLLDESRWENDWEPDGYVANDFGTEDSVVTV